MPNDVRQRLNDDRQRLDDERQWLPTTVSGWPPDFSITTSPAFKSMECSFRVIDPEGKLAGGHDGPITQTGRDERIRRWVAIRPK